jgi:hypothetical protein
VKLNSNFRHYAFIKKLNVYSYDTDSVYDLGSEEFTTESWGLQGIIDVPYHHFPVGQVEIIYENVITSGDFSGTVEFETPDFTYETQPVSNNYNGNVTVIFDASSEPSSNGRWFLYIGITSGTFTFSNVKVIFRENTQFFNNLNLGTGYDNAVYAISNIDNNTNVVVGGAFHNFNSTSRFTINSKTKNGSPDTSFVTNLGTGFSGGTIYTIDSSSYWQSLIYIGGAFTQFNGNTRNRFCVLNFNGAENATWATAIGTGFGGADPIVRRVRNSKVSAGPFVMGGWTSFNGNSNYRRILKFNSNGVHNTAWSNNLVSNDAGTNSFDGPVYDVDEINTGSALTSSVIIGGWFNLFGGGWRKSLVKVNYNSAAQDNDFYSNLTNNAPIGNYSNSDVGFNGAIHSVRVHKDFIVVGGSFTQLNGVTRNRLAFLNYNGYLNTTVQNNIGTGFNGLVLDMFIQRDNKIVIVGEFTQFNGNTRNRIVRLNADGTEDTAFYSNVGGFNDRVRTVTTQNGVLLLIGGDFTSYKSLYNRMVCLDLNGNLYQA